MILLIGVGSNIDPGNKIPEALRALSRTYRITGLSPFFRNPPLERPEQQDYLNGIVRVDTAAERDPETVKSTLKRIEAALGRVRDPEDTYAPRTIDLDLLVLDRSVLDPEDFTDRPFNLAAAAALEPELIIPNGMTPGITAARLYEQQVNQGGLTPLPDFDLALKKEFLP